MFLEDDGRNCKQMCQANVYEFLREFLRQCLLEGAVDNNGWPRENELNTLAVALFWFITSRCCIRETIHLRREFMDLLSHYAYACFRYSCSTEPKYQFYPSLHVAQLAQQSLASPCPSSVTVQYFGEETALVLPPIALYAILHQFARAERYPLQVPSGLPANRQEALMRGILQGPTKEDIEYFNNRCTARFNCISGLQSSREHDPDWYWALHSLRRGSLHVSPGAYVFGALAGHWYGSFMAPSINNEGPIVPSGAPLALSASCRFPTYVRFREYYCYSPWSAVPVMDDENAFSNAFLPRGCHWYRTEDGIKIVGANHSFDTFYTSDLRQPLSELYNDGAHGGICDIIIIGETEEPYATAWNSYRYIGRVRPCDGLVVLLREPSDGSGSFLLRGYVISSRHLVGRLRNLLGNEEATEWESTFCLSKDLTAQ